MWSFTSGLYSLKRPAWILSRYSGFLPQSKNMQTGVRLTGHSKLPVGVSVDGCLSLYVSPPMNCRLILGVPNFARRCWDRLQRPLTGQPVENGWMDVFNLCGKTQPRELNVEEAYVTVFLTGVWKVPCTEWRNLVRVHSCLRLEIIIIIIILL